MKFLSIPFLSKYNFHSFAVTNNDITANLVPHSVNKRYFLIRQFNRLGKIKNIASRLQRTKYLKSLVSVKKINYTDKQLTSTKRAKNLLLGARFSNYLMRHGLKEKAKTAFNLGLQEFYMYFYFYNKKADIAYKYYEDILELRPTFGNFYKFENILKFFVLELEPFFYLKVKKVEKKYRKKLKKKFTSDVVYIKPKKRANLVFKALTYYPKMFSQYELSIRIGQALFKTLVERKDSYLYQRKIFMYAKVLKKFQKAVL